MTRYTQAISYQKGCKIIKLQLDYLQNAKYCHSSSLKVGSYLSLAIHLINIQD